MSKTALTIGGLALGAVLFGAFNVFANSALPRARFDLTEEKFYTLSQGSKNIVKEIDEPLNLYLYFSKSQIGEATELKTYAQRVRELLDEYVLASNGKLVLKQIDPLPFSEEQDRAQAAGLAALPLNRSDTAYFGLVGTNSTGDQEVIGYFNPQNERTLEYDVTRLIHTLAHPEKKVIGVVSSLPLDGGGGLSMQRDEPWPIITQLRQLFEVRTLDLSSGDVPADVHALLVVHPKGLSDEALYAIDQFVMSGKHALVFVDPHCEVDPSGQDPNNPFAGMQADKGSNLRKLFDAWGVELVDAKVAGDMDHLLQVRDQRGKVVPNLTWLGLNADALSQDDPVVNGLENLIFATAGILRQREGATTSFSPLVQTGERSAPIEKSKISFYPEYDKLLAQFSPEGKRLTLAARISGPAKSAFTERPPEPPPAEGEAPPTPESHPAHIAEAREPLNLIVFGDVDLLHERFWFEAQRFGGMVLGYRKLSDNGDLAINAADNLAGSNDLISVRARGVLARPFTEVEKLRTEAEQRFLQKQESIEAEIRETQNKITELQKVRGDQANLMMSPEQTVEIQRLEEKLFAGRKELRAVQRELDRDIESLGTRIKLFNMTLIPLALAGFALFYLLRRHDRQSV
ncbi:MAG: hypothetical protein FJ299_03430 [Planctomycetes bacterium]|nr:hypothetical protein [Planctomycetota bacterium]